MATGIMYDPERISEEDELIIGAEVGACQLHHLLWVVRFMLDRPLDEWRAVFARAYELSCISVTRQKRLATIRWERRMSDKTQPTETGAENAGERHPMGGGGECGAFPLPTPLSETPGAEELVRFEQALAHIDPTFFAQLMDLPKG
jgi:hypothetical protein